MHNTIYMLHLHKNIHKLKNMLATILKRSTKNSILLTSKLLTSFNSVLYFSASESKTKINTKDEFYIRNCLQNNLGFTNDQINTILKVRPSLLSGSPAETNIPGLWNTLERLGFKNFDKFRELCTKEPRITNLDTKKFDLLLTSMAEYGILGDTDRAMEIFIENPKILLKKAEDTRRLLIVLYRLIESDKKFIGDLVLRVPQILLKTVFFIN